jgi:hypothetical protein
LSLRFPEVLLFSEGFCADKGMKEVDEEELEALV